MADVETKSKSRILGRVLTLVVLVLTAITAVFLVISYHSPFGHLSATGPLILYRDFYRVDCPEVDSYISIIRSEVLNLSCGHGELVINRRSSIRKQDVRGLNFPFNMPRTRCIIPGFLSQTIMQAPNNCFKITLLQVPLAGTLGVLSLFLVLLFAERRWRYRRNGENGCPACGYDLSFNTSGTCPECGKCCDGDEPIPER